MMLAVLFDVFCFCPVPLRCWTGGGGAVTVRESSAALRATHLRSMALTGTLPLQTPPLYGARFAAAMLLTPRPDADSTQNEPSRRRTGDGDSEEKGTAAARWTRLLSNNTAIHSSSAANAWTDVLRMLRRNAGNAV